MERQDRLRITIQIDIPRVMPVAMINAFGTAASTTSPSPSPCAWMGTALPASVQQLTTRSASERLGQTERGEQAGAERRDLHDLAVLDAQHVELERPEHGVAGPA
jgi:hypothetical protein